MEAGGGGKVEGSPAHCLQSTQGIKTPARDIDLIKNRLKSVKEILG